MNFKIIFFTLQVSAVKPLIKAEVCPRLHRHFETSQSMTVLRENYPQLYSLCFKGPIRQIRCFLC